MSYTLKEIYFTLQGEGAHSGRAAVFARMTGCNLWSGREQDRSSAPCWFCDTDFVGTNGPGGGRFATGAELAAVLRQCWDDDQAAPGGRPYVVFTGGEPMLQLDKELIDACHACNLEIGLETNGTIPVPPGVDWICVSPKPNSQLVQTTGDELKLVYPQEIEPDAVAHLEFTHFFLQPRDGVGREEHTKAAINYCLTHPQWRLSLQTHKLLGIP
ncbi:MAG TPA: 7-carboxy-7-deazaguanine synthase [Deltaproteobacteria bacterium]|nr:7-carboxy-7-deazaguanine synthase [Deltaproteobacteria bacterium]HCP44669.1 7-carboxy-7-deazaguanine synthase [Deltaproteobacteria bacterium]